MYICSTLINNLTIKLKSNTIYRFLFLTDVYLCILIFNISNISIVSVYKYQYYCWQRIHKLKIKSILIERKEYKRKILIDFKF